MHNIRIPPSRPKCDKKTIRVGTDMIDKNKLMYICTVTFPTPFIKYRFKLARDNSNIYIAIIQSILKGICIFSPIHSFIIHDEFNRKNINIQDIPIHAFCSFLYIFLIHGKSFLVYASVNADQKGVSMIIIIMLNMLKYLYAIL